MEKEFVTYELALRLKLLGYNKPCFGYYLENGFWTPASYSEKGTFYPSNSDLMDEWVSSPTWQSAFKWFRDIYEIDGFVQVEPLNEKYGFVVYNRKIQNYTESNRKMTIEEAELACLEKLCEIVEQQVK
jgi:hypothetical protein